MYILTACFFLFDDRNTIHLNAYASYPGRLSVGKNCVGIVRPSFLISLLCVLITRQNHYCNGDAHFVVPTATSNTCRRPCLGALDSGEGFRRSLVGGTDDASFTLVERPVPSPLPMSCAPSLIRSNDYQSRSHRESNRQSSAEGNRCSSLDNRHYGQRYFLDLDGVQ